MMIGRRYVVDNGHSSEFAVAAMYWSIAVMGTGTCLRIGMRVLEVGGTCRKGFIASSLHIASQWFPLLQSVVIDVVAVPDTRYVHGVRLSSVAGLFEFSVTGLGWPGLAIKAVEIPGVACEE